MQFYKIQSLAPAGLCRYWLCADPLNLNNLVKALKVRGVVREQAGNIVSQHGSDDIGIVDLLAADGKVLRAALSSKSLTAFAASSMLFRRP